MSDVRTTLERVTLAYESKDLGMVSSELHRIKDADVLVATGIAASREGLSASIMSIHTGGNATSLNRSRESVLNLARKLNVKRHWKLDDATVTRVAELSLVHHISPACRHCHGRGYHTIPGAPALSSRQCSHCKGSRMHPIPKRHRDYILHVLAILARAESMMEYKIWKLLR